MSNVLVTGGSGFLGGHVILKLLAAGHLVRATIRNADREAQVRATISAAGGDIARLGFAVTDLASDGGWAEAAEDCDFVHHVASPFPLTQPKDAEDLIRPAVDGALRVLKASRDAGVRRVILTSSFAAIGYGHGVRATPYTEEDWTVVDTKGVQPYTQSKALAERAAWDFIEREGGGLELSVVNPVAIFGPPLANDLSPSVEIVRQILLSKLPGTPDIWIGAVDVRDVAALHLLAMESPEAAGQRYLAIAGEPISFNQIALLLHDHFQSRVPRRLPNWLIRAAPFSTLARDAAPRLGVRARASNDKAKALGWEPISNEDAILASAQSLRELGLA